MVQPLRESRDRYEELKQIDDAMNEVCTFLSAPTSFLVCVTEDVMFPSGAEEEERELDHGREEEVNFCEKGELKLRRVQANATESESSRALSRVCAAANVEHPSEVVRHVGLHGLKISASCFKEPGSRGLWEIQIQTLR